MDTDALEALRRTLSLQSGLPSPAAVHRFQREILAFHRDHGRSFPWRDTQDPYRILVSELMLQQTQTHRVVPKYESFLRRFPTIQKLAEAANRDVVEAWQGLGYNRRALYLRDTARRIVDEHGGVVPGDPAVLRSFPGIGPATAAEIAAFAYGVASPLIETNIRRLFIHLFTPDGRRVTDQEILALVDHTLYRADPRRWYYALMDFGVWLREHLCSGGNGDPNKRSTSYSVQSPFEGSNRQIRGRVLRLLVHGRPVAHADILGALSARDAVTPTRLRAILQGLEDEGFLRAESGAFRMV